MFQIHSKMDVIKAPFYYARSAVNSSFASKEPWQIVTTTTVTVLTLVWLYEVIFEGDESMCRYK